MGKYNRSYSYSYSNSGFLSTCLMCFLFFILLVFCILLFQRYQQSTAVAASQVPPYNQQSAFMIPQSYSLVTEPVMQGNGQVWPPNVLGNPYAAPLRDERYMVGPPVVPINVPTNPGYVETSYRQMGVLSPSGHGGGSGGGGRNDDLLILMGRPLFTNRDQWQYYAVSNQRNGVKLPLTIQNRNSTGEYGVKELNDGNVVIVNGYNKPYKVGMYEADTIKYLPYA